jgi:hypothetical protein
MLFGIFLDRPWYWLLPALMASFATPVFPAEFKVGPVSGLVDFSLAYGVLFRLQDRDDRLIAPANRKGGKATSANLDDGTLNYGKGIVFNQVRGDAELTLSWRDFGLFLRGAGFYDFETEKGDRDHRPLSSTAKELVGSDIDLLDSYIRFRTPPDSRLAPINVRLGRQVVSWGESGFGNGINIINALDGAVAPQPTTRPKDIQRPQGMLWGVLQINELLAVEGFYQYEWKKTLPPPWGSFFSTSDPGSPGSRFIQTAYGKLSDLGTDLDAFYGLPPGTLGFDPRYQQITRIDSDDPKDGGQFGFSVQGFVPRWNDMSIGAYFANYHSRLPVVNSISPGEEAFENATFEAALETAQALLQKPGVTPQAAVTAGIGQAINQYIQQEEYFLEYPENIQMLGVSFNTSLLSTGTNVFGEFSYTLGTPLQIDSLQVLWAGSSGMEVAPELRENLFTKGESITPDTVTKGFIERDKSQLSLGFSQLFGPRFRASQTLVFGEAAYIHIHNMPSKDKLPLQAEGVTATNNPEYSEPGGPQAGIPPVKNKHLGDADSWGYRLGGQLTYTGLLGGLNLTPRLVWTHDVNGNTPGPLGNFTEGKKSITIGLGGQYLNQSLTANISYTNFFGAGKYNLLNDRDFLSFNVRFIF